MSSQIYPLEKSRRFLEMKPNSGHRDNSRLSCAAGDAQLLIYLGRHLRADAADDPAAFLRLAQILLLTGSAFAV
jgi:hypothetical protein